MSAYDFLLDASFKGIPFYVESEELTQFGRRIVNHEYPNTNEQYSEDTGGFPENFTISGYVIGEDAKDQINALINACNEEGAGKLVLPFFGVRMATCGQGSASVLPYVDAENIPFTIEFSISRENAGFVEESFDLFSVLGLNELSMGSLSSVFGERFKTSADIFAKSIKIFDINAMLNVARRLAKNVIGDEYGALLRQIDNIAGDLDRLVDNGSLLGSKLSNAFNALFTGLIGSNTNSLIQNLVDESNSFSSRLPISEVAIKNPQDNQFYNINFWPETTESRIERNEQRSLVVSYSRLMMLIIAYSLLATSKFDTEEELSNIKNILENEYLNVIHGLQNIIQGQRLQSGVNQDVSLITQKDVWTDFEKLRIVSLIASEQDDVVLYKIDYGLVRVYWGTSVLNAAYLSSAEVIKTEQDLLNISRIMYNINNREPYHLKGQIKILRKLI
ncbi:DNA circularization N-terminal domain-containing protein [Neisseria sp. Ec49-e6-T10]|uniref:DNA circularization N-terminal domain-containing protein n=1 Tax=Neisseria sp. Ec49-e6-T10 TaxID=3140744 RepID=UPI003EBFED29